ncbi:hypothetical protein, partial [Propioniciclava flava]
MDAVINMFGSPMTGRWTTPVKEELRSTRATGTLSVVSMLEPQGRCQRLLALSLTRFYADAGAAPVTGTPRPVLDSCPKPSGCGRRQPTQLPTRWLKRRTKNAKAFHDKCENTTGFI